MIDDKQMVKKPGDLIRSEDWNELVRELKELREYINNMTWGTTLTNLASNVGTEFDLSGSGVPEDFNYGFKVLGLITKQYFRGFGDTGLICRFGINDYADTIFYYAAAAKGNTPAIRINLRYMDDTIEPSPDLYIHEWTKMQLKGVDPADNNPFLEVLAEAAIERYMYKYAFKNPNAEKEIRYIEFEDISSECGPRVGNVIHYVARVKPLDEFLEGTKSKNE